MVVHKTFLDAFLAIANCLLLSPQTTTKAIILVVVVMLVFSISLKVVADVFGAKATNVLFGFVSGLVGGAFLLSAAALVNVHLLPQMTDAPPALQYTILGLILVGVALALWSMIAA